MTTLSVEPYTLAVFAPPAPDGRVAYLIGGAEDGAAVYSLVAEPKPTLVAVGGVDWERDLSPWAAARAFRGGADFTGGAAAFLAALTGRIVPEAERVTGAAAVRGVAGYSLAGLFAVWSAWNTDAFARVASVSGSMWFDGFAAYLAENVPPRVPARAYFSVGDRERLTRNVRMAAVETCTEAAAARCESLGAATRFERNPGGHFQDVPARIARGIDYMMGQEAAEWTR